MNTAISIWLTTYACVVLLLVPRFGRRTLVVRDAMRVLCFLFAAPVMLAAVALGRAVR